MAVTDMIETSEDRDGSLDMTKTTYNRSWLIQTDSVYDTALTVLAYPDLPAIGEFYSIEDEEGEIVEQSDEAILVKLTPHQIDKDPYFWILVGEYSTEDPHQTTDPLLRPAEAEWKQVKYKKAVYKGSLIVDDTIAAESTITNSAGEPFLPPRELEKHFWRLTYTRNEASFDPEIMDKFTDTLNEDAWKGFESLTVKCSAIEGKRSFESGQYFWHVVYVFEWKKEGWTETFLDKGKNKLVDGVLTLITAKGTGVAQERLLDGSGGVLPVIDDPVYREYAVITEFSTFADLQIGSLD